MAVSHVTQSVLGFALTVLLACSISQAQEAHPLPRHPGDVIKFEIKFDGPNAGKIDSVSGGLGLRSAVPKDQAGFRPGFGANGSPLAPDTFRLELTVPNNAATGDYYLQLRG